MKKHETRLINSFTHNPSCPQLPRAVIKRQEPGFSPATICRCGTTALVPKTLPTENSEIKPSIGCLACVQTITKL